MKNLIGIFFLLSFFSCVKIKIGPWPPSRCTSDSTSISVEVIDFYSGKAVPNVPLQLYDQGFWSIYGPMLVVELVSDSNGMAAFQYAQDSLSAYYLEILPDSNMTHIYPWRVKVAPGCDHDWKILMKPVQNLTLILRNNGLKPFGKSYISVVRQHGNYSYYQNDDIIGSYGYSFGFFSIDTIHKDFEQEFFFKVIPEEELEIRFISGTTKRVEKIYTGSMGSTAFLFSI